MKPAILIVEEDTELRRRLHRLLSSERMAVTGASDGAEALRSIPTVPDLVIVGSSSNGTATSLNVAKLIRRTRNHVPIIFITPNSSEELAIAALRIGISDYFTHPVPFDQLTASIKRCLASSAPDGVARGRAAEGTSYLIGDSPRMREILSYVAQVAVTECTVLITGETGTGKELTAELIHRSSPRWQKPFVHINCAAIPDTLLESELFGYERGAFTGASESSGGRLRAADGGTVLFDEIGDMSLHAQAKILRVIETREIERLGGRRSSPVDVRVIAATNQDLDRLMADGRFRKDLYFRLNVVRIHLPPLRERKEDVPALLGRYIREFSRTLGPEVEGVTDDALAALLRHDWPGNVRELRNLVEATCVTLRSRRLSLADLPMPYRRLGDAGEALREAERERLLAALLATKWNKSRAAEQLHWSRMTVYRKIAKYNLVAARGAAPGPSTEPVTGDTAA